MNFNEFAQELGIEGKAMSITRIHEAEPNAPYKEGCAFRSLKHAMEGEQICLSEEDIKCFGGKIGFGFSDGPMQVPGGYGSFVSYGAGEGFPAGMRLKKTPELAEQGSEDIPKSTMEGYKYIQIKPYEEGDSPDLVTICANPTQLSALTLLYGYRLPGNDNAVMLSGSACSSVFQMAFAEQKKDAPKAVIGNTDVSVRQNFDSGTFFFTVSGEAFANMLEDAGESFLIAAAWKRLKETI
ncbi:MAG: DUF169 domain-containing protein [Eubacteriaceae bacterium]|nr:DUF169 domain-containing protein [Eubacteriaceae bacterium]